MPDMELHYRLANGFKPDASLIGSATVVAGQAMFGGPVRPKKRGISIRRSATRSALVDRRRFRRETRGTAPHLPPSGVLPRCDRSCVGDHARVLSEASGSRRYRSISAGSGKVDLHLALSRLANEFGIGRVVTDTGPILSGVLLNEGLVDEVSLLVHPIIKGEGSRNLMGEVHRDIALTLDRAEAVGNGCVWLVYKRT